MSGVAAITLGVVVDGDGSLWRVAVAARPAVETVAKFGGIVQRKGGRLVGIGGGVIGAAAVKVVGNGVCIAGVQ